MKVAVVLNSGSGTVRQKGSADLERSIIEAFRARGHEPSIHKAEGAPQSAIESALAACPDILVAAGGDGTVGAAAKALLGGGTALGVIPSGTMNLFAKDWDIPDEVDAAVECICKGRDLAIDAAEVNGVHFFHHSSVGLVPRVVRRREQIGYSSRREKLFALLRAFARSIFEARSMRIVIRSGGETRAMRTSLVLAAPGPASLEHAVLQRTAPKNDGALCLLVAHQRSPIRSLLLLLKELLGLRPPDEGFETIRGSRITLELRRPRYDVTCDGEMHRLASPLEYAVLPNALRIRVPAQPTDA